MKPRVSFVENEEMRAVLRRVRPPTSEAPSEIVVGPLLVELVSRRAWMDGTEVSLSRKEFDLLAELVSHAGEVVTREDLISRVWDENWFGSTKTLDVHVGWQLGDDASAPRWLHARGPDRASSPAVVSAAATTRPAMSRQIVGLSSEPLTGGNTLAPAEAATPEPTARPTRTATPRPTRTPKATRTPRPTATAVPTVDDDNSGSGSDGDDDSGRGRGRGRGGDDDD